MKPILFFLLSLILASLACVQPVPNSHTAPSTPPAPRQARPVTTPIAAPTPMRQAMVSALRSVNIRTDATEHSRDVGDLFNGQVVIVIGCKSGWAQIGEYQFVKGYYLGGICK